MNPEQAAETLLSDPASFAQAGRHSLRPYQLEVARAITRSVVRREGKTFTVMFARQMGKNETSAQLEAYLLALFAGSGGQMVKAAPSFKPQVINSMLRLRDILEGHPLTAGRWNPTFGFMFRLGRAGISFFSADRTANVVGATASLLLEIDEAQDVDPDKYDREFRPMASSTNATTVLYGTAWAEDSLLERERAHNLALQHRIGERLHFEFDWSVLAAINPQYRAFVEAEMERLGVDHPIIRTQYLLHTMQDAGRFFSNEQRTALQGAHSRERDPVAGVSYVAGIDVAGEDEQAEDAAARSLHPRKDSTVITIARIVRAGGSGEAAAEVVEHIWWTGRDQVWQYEQIAALWQRWNFARVSIDASGIGYGLAQFLAARFGERACPITFSASFKSKLGYNLLAAINTGRLQVYAPDGSPEIGQFWREVAACRYQLRAQEILGWGVPELEGHDDFVVSLALCANAVRGLPAPARGTLIRAEKDNLQGW